MATQNIFMFVVLLYACTVYPHWTKNMPDPQQELNLQPSVY